MWLKKEKDVALEGKGCGLKKKWEWLKKEKDVALEGKGCGLRRKGV